MEYVPISLAEYLKSNRSSLEPELVAALDSLLARLLQSARPSLHPKSEHLLDDPEDLEKLMLAQGIMWD